LAEARSRDSSALAICTQVSTASLATSNGLCLVAETESSDKGAFHRDPCASRAKNKRSLLPFSAQKNRRPMPTYHWQPKSYYN
jgi:hypothetical protein